MKTKEAIDLFLEAKVGIRAPGTIQWHKGNLQRFSSFIGENQRVESIDIRQLRQWRIEFEGALYHILSRGNEQRDIFLEDDDRNCFLDVLGEMSERFAVDIFAYVLMDNHYHLLLRTREPNLSKSMQWMGTTYTRRFNLNHFRSGHLFQGRYKSIIVENDAYLVRLSCYIHRNPLSPHFS